MSVILATQEAEIRRIAVRSQPRQIVHETLSQKKPSQQRAQGESPEFKAQYHKKKKKGLVEKISMSSRNKLKISHLV
jgi:hypothetical protein